MGYPGINKTSKFEDFQLNLFKNGEPDEDPCPKPCPACHTAESGEACYAAILFAIRTGIHNDPDKYPGLNSSSSFEAFQLKLHEHAEPEKAPCPKPCPCHSAVKGGACYAAVKWAMRTGIYEKPDDYPGLSNESSFDDFQSLLMTKEEPKKDPCPKPCTVVRKMIGTMNFSLIVN